RNKWFRNSLTAMRSGSLLNRFSLPSNQAERDRLLDEKEQYFRVHFLDRRPKVDQWYLTDIRIIHSILYFFPNDIAIEMANTLLSRIYNYKDFQDSNRLVTTLKLNLSLLLIKEKDFKTALNVLEDILNKHKVGMTQQSLSVLFIRIAICRKMLQLGKEDEYLEQAAQLLKIYDQEEFLEQVMKDYKYYTNLQ
ncbi:hypothetical protein, partial [Planomicrobium sp. MB-3u-38]|uniref:Rgg family transcriptional regulator n=1 Tax=Planomicrobium sp. MB-3u-38 TaxID=2058318 RepID=UPI000CBE7AAF